MILTEIEKLLIIRRRLGLTADEAATRWRLNVRTLHAWEQGVNKPMPKMQDRLEKIAAKEAQKL